MIIQIRDFTREPLTKGELNLISLRLDEINFVIDKGFNHQDFEWELKALQRILEKSCLGAKLYEKGWRIIK